MLCYLDIAKTWEILFVLSEELSEYSENEGYIIVFFFILLKKKKKKKKVKKKIIQYLWRIHVETL